MTYAEMAALDRYMGLEIHNGHCITGLGQNPVTYPAYAVDRWDDLLTNNRTDIWGFAVDDLHKVGAYETYDIGRVRVFVPSNTVSNVVSALAAGHFVADVSNHGLTPGYPVRTDEGVSVTCTGATRIDAIGSGGALLASAAADNLSYNFGGDERYVRLVAYSDFTEPFDAASDRWYGSAAWAVTGGVLALTGTVNPSRYTLRKHRIGDFSARVDVKLSDLGTDSGALLFNVLSTNYYMMLRIGASSTPGYSNTLTLSWTTNDAPDRHHADRLDGLRPRRTSGTRWPWTTWRPRAPVGQGVAAGRREPDWQISGTYTGWHHGAFGFRANRSAQFDNFYADGFQTYYQPIAVELAVA